MTRFIYLIGALALVGAGCAKTAEVSLNLDRGEVEVRDERSVETVVEAEETNEDADAAAPGAQEPETADGPQEQPNTEVSTEVEVEADATVRVPEERVFNVVASQWAFEPSVIRALKGDHVVLHLRSVDVDHGFRLPEFGVDANLRPGTEQTIEFDADQAGTFSFFCDVFCGAGHAGMRGTLIVE